jgi:hypothetical protein
MFEPIPEIEEISITTNRQGKSSANIQLLRVALPRYIKRDNCFLDIDTS